MTKWIETISIHTVFADCDRNETRNCLKAFAISIHTVFADCDEIDEYAIKVAMLFQSTQSSQTVTQPIPYLQA